MENATQALLIAGGVLIAILILSLGVAMIHSFQKGSDAYITTLDTVELEKYNNKFSVYANRQDITAQEIITVVNYAQQKDLGTQVYIDSSEYTAKSDDKKNNFLKNNISTKFKCTNISYDSNGMVNKIAFCKL